MPTDTALAPAGATPYVFIDQDDPYQKNSMNLAGSFSLRKLLTAALVLLERNKLGPAEFNEYLNTLYYIDQDSKESLLGLVGALPKTQADSEGNFYSILSKTTHDQLIEHLNATFSGLPVDRSSNLVVTAVSSVWPGGEEKYFFNLAELAVDILVKSQVIVPIGSPAVGYGCNLNQKIYARLSQLIGEMVIRSGPDSVLPLLQFYEFEAYLRDRLIAHYSTLQAQLTATGAQLEELRSQIAALKKQAQNANPYTWEV